MIAILGVSDYARDVRDIATAIGLKSVLVGPDDDAEWIARDGARLVLGTGTPAVKKKLVAMYGRDRNWATLVHPAAFVSPSAKIARGVTVTAGSYICANAVLDEWSTVTWTSTVGHGARIGRYSTVFPGSNLGGDCQVGEGVVVGSGCKVFPRVKIGDYAKVGMASIVIEDLPEHKTALPSSAWVVGCGF